MTTEYDDLCEQILCATSPGSPMFDSSQTDFAVQDAALACAGMPPIWYSAAMWRVLADRMSYRILHSRLTALALCNPSKAVRRRAGYIAALVLAEDRAPTLLERVGLTATLLRAHPSQYRRDLKKPHLDIRARLESWNRGAVSWMAKRCR